MLHWWDVFFVIFSVANKKGLGLDMMSVLYAIFAAVILALTHCHHLVSGYTGQALIVVWHGRCCSYPALFVLGGDSYVPSKIDLGAAAKTKRPTSCVLITPPKETKDSVWDPSTKALFGELKEVCAQEMSQVPT